MRIRRGTQNLLFTTRMIASRPVRMGILGAARIVNAALLRPAKAVPEVAVIGIASRERARAQAFASRHGLPQAFDSYEALIDSPAIDAVYIALPNGLHGHWSSRALQAGKHVLCEKPLAAHAAEAAKLENAARSADRVLVEAFHYRYHPLMSRVRSLLDSGVLGPLTHLEADLCVPLLGRNRIAYRYDLAGGATMDVGCYPVNLLRWAARAEPAVVMAEARLAEPNVDRCMEAYLQFPGGVTAHLFCSLFSWVLLRSRARIRGRHGHLLICNPFQPHRYHRLVVQGPGGRVVERVDGETTYIHQLRAFARAVRAAEPVPTDARDAVANMRVIDSIYLKAGLDLRPAHQGG